MNKKPLKLAVVILGALAIAYLVHCAASLSATKRQMSFLVSYTVIAQAGQYEYFAKNIPQNLMDVSMVDGDFELSLLRAHYFLNENSPTSEEKYQLENALSIGRKVAIKYPLNSGWIKKDTVIDLGPHEPVLPRRYDCYRALVEIVGEAAIKK